MSEKLGAPTGESTQSDKEEQKKGDPENPSRRNILRAIGGLAIAGAVGKLGETAYEYKKESDIGEKLSSEKNAIEKKNADLKKLIEEKEAVIATWKNDLEVSVASVQRGLDQWKNIESTGQIVSTKKIAEAAGLLAKDYAEREYFKENKDVADQISEKALQEGLTKNLTELSNNMVEYNASIKAALTSAMSELKKAGKEINFRETIVKEMKLGHKGLDYASEKSGQESDGKDIYGEFFKNYDAGLTYIREKFNAAQSYLKAIKPMHANPAIWASVKSPDIFAQHQVLFKVKGVLYEVLKTIKVTMDESEQQAFLANCASIAAPAMMLGVDAFQELQLRFKRSDNYYTYNHQDYEVEDIDTKRRPSSGGVYGYRHQAVQTTPRYRSFSSHSSGHHGGHGGHGGG